MSLTPCPRCGKPVTYRKFPSKFTSGYYLVAYNGRVRHDPFCPKLLPQRYRSPIQPTVIPDTTPPPCPPNPDVDWLPGSGKYNDWD